ncbi:MAG: Nucleolar protein 16 [Trizodia sp. TS-e1964]|nr:MAG: Nucleolar protein 16 [Trizodia sp. TS-e1964]
MGRELQKKKRRSSIPKVRQKPKSKKVNPRGNVIVAANWHKSETLVQNYRRLGLSSRLNTSTGGIEKLPSILAANLRSASFKPQSTAPSEVQVERDPDTGAILRVISSAEPNHLLRKKAKNPLQDPLRDLDISSEPDSGSDHGNDEDPQEPKQGIISLLEQQAAQSAGPVIRKQSVRESQWISALVESHSDDYAAMSRDRRLNRMQQSPADIQRRVLKWRRTNAVDGDVGIVREMDTQA